MSSQLSEACKYYSVDNTFVWYCNFNLDYMFLYFYSLKIHVFKQNCWFCSLWKTLKKKMNSFRDFAESPEAILMFRRKFSVLRVTAVILNEIMAQTRIILGKTIISTVQNKLLLESSKFRIHCKWKQIQALLLTPTVECVPFPMNA